MGNNRMGLPMVLFLIFLILKLTNTIDWSWWWVSAPLWIPFALIVGVAAIIGATLLIAKALADD